MGISVAGHAAVIHVDPAAGTEADGTARRPFASLQAALASLPGAPDEPMTVHLAPGVHRVESTLEIHSAHTREKPLIFDGNGRAVISGGRRLTDWKISDGRWTHAWEGYPVRELFVNGERRPRSRFPNDGWLRVAEALPDKRSGFTTQQDLPAMGPGAELVFLHDWSISRIPVASVDARTLRTRGPIGFPAAHYVIDFYEPHPRYALENDPSFLHEPGTWCHDPVKRQLVYLPRTGETPDRAVIEIPVVTQLLRVSGTAEQPVRDVRFQGISFELCRWQIPQSGYAEGQATKHVPRDQAAGDGDPHGQWQFVPWAVVVERSEGIVFEKCRFRNLGGSGVLLGAATAACALESCRVSDVSGNGIGIGEGAERRIDGKNWWVAAPRETAVGNRVENSLIERCGAQFHGAVGIWVGLAKDTRIAHNELRDLPYTGISVGWMWNPTPTPCAGNLVEGNHIHHVMQLLSDGGGIYTLGRQPGTVLRDNLIHDVPLNAGRAESNGLFLDEGSSGFLIEGNLIFATDKSPLRFHKAGNITVAGNRWVLPGDTPPLRFNATDPAVIDARENLALDQQAMNAAVAAWREKHPAPAKPGGDF